MPRAILDMMDRRPIWAMPDWVPERIRDALPAGWELVVIDEETDGSGDGAARVSKRVLDAVAEAEIYFGYGIHALTAKNAEVTSGDVPRWLVHVIIVILMVLFLDIAWRNRDGAPCDREPDHARGEGRSAVSASWPRARSGGRSTRPVPRTDPQAGEAEDHADPRRAGHGGQRRRQLGGPSPQREVTRGSEAAPSNPARAQAARRWSANQGRTWGNTCRR